MILDVPFDAQRRTWYSVLRRYPFMTMTVAIPSNLQDFIQQVVNAGEARSEEELVARALELYREMRARHATLKEDVQRSLAEADCGEVSELDVEAIIARGTDRLARQGIAD
jgi:Arc/MetJ-type ribon-helix-helix transcriptional regulator